MLKRWTPTDTVVAAILGLVALTSLVPILNTIAISLSDKTSAAMGKVYVWPVNFNLSSYQAILEEKQFLVSFMNSVKRVAIGVSINLILIILMAYPLSKAPAVFRAKRYYIWVVVFTMLFNGGLVPTFLVVKNLQLMDSVWALVLPGAVPVFSVILLMNFFKSVPESLEEAAMVDGASPWYLLWRVYIPLSKAAIATVALFAVVMHWNAFFDGKIYINTPEKLPLQTYIQSLVVDLNPQQMANMTPEQLEEHMKMSSLTFNSAKVMVSMIPILLVYPFLQRYFVKGIVIGAVKE
ncbi:carbohydrate ABC transporter permease [Paenibacillaceae bacterium WGS1546]|uniref:carbohydrate ABC transporter permease n=1 Tax=Cohnella sp. WGS1546 TaxID=3366810 RepID=UPI00372CF899